MTEPIYSNTLLKGIFISVNQSTTPFKVMGGPTHISAEDVIGKLIQFYVFVPVGIKVLIRYPSNQLSSKNKEK